MKLVLRPLTRDEANAAIRAWHRHHQAVKGCRFAVGVSMGAGGELCGAVIVGRPSAPALDTGDIFEITRLATPTEAPPHAASRLIGAATRAAREMGVRFVVSYTRADEPGTCYRAAGYLPTAYVEPDDWQRRASHTARPFLPGLFHATTEVIGRVRWEFPAGRVAPEPLEFVEGRWRRARSAASDCA